MTITSHSLTPPDHLAGRDDLKLVAYVWECGDDCDCTEPIIAWQWRERTTAGVKFYKWETVWRGTFVIGDSREDGDPWAHDELTAECERLGIVFMDAS